ncbi:hypothetical protein [Corallococcus terminator]|uniref:Uncharacterized protein n=1 Tax=Corallococcus terminator TaxID=2316733 RepID=A0A3A8IAU4_9BACT|nr:hypothetical protein [Corallococcus terminator]RKG76890.1 hypothetical protein D7V88_31700 [Corallococcus terminator]
MAIIIKGITRCRICGSGDLSLPYIGTSGMAFPKGDELHPYCDALLHLDCLARWPHRERFSRGYFDRRRDDPDRSNGVLLAERRTWLLRCGPASPDAEPYFAEVLLIDWPMRLYSRWAQWDDYVAQGYGQRLSGEALMAAGQVMSEVRQVAPTLEVLGALRQQALTQPSPGGSER